MILCGLNTMGLKIGQVVGHQSQITMVSRQSTQKTWVYDGWVGQQVQKNCTCNVSQCAKQGTKPKRFKCVHSLQVSTFKENQLHLESFCIQLFFIFLESFFVFRIICKLFQQGELEQAEKCGELAKEVDGYNAAAYVNLGNCSLAKGEQQKAKQLYTLALDNDASCVEALYNLGKCISTKRDFKGRTGLSKGC